LLAFEKPPYLAISQGSGDVKVHEQIMLELTYAPRDVHTLEGSMLQIVIPAGPVETMFQIALGGGAKRSRVDFSFLTHDFGPCFIAKGGATMAGEPLSPSEDQRYERVELIATNRDDSDCLISTTFQREPWLDVQLNAAMIAAGESMRIPIVFSPREVSDYMQRIEFIVNDYTRMHVDVRGRGCPLRLELTSLEMQHVDFGVTTGGEPVTKMVRLINRSPRAVTFQLGDEKEELTRRSVYWSPAHPTTLRPKETCDVELRFNPMTRVAPFKVPLIARCDGGLDLKLLTVEGTCHATEMRLSEHSCFFGDVVVGSQSERVVRLHNFGDLGAKFKFELPARFGKIFSLSPSEGFVRPQEEISITVSFHPTRERVMEYKRAERANAMRRGKPLPAEVPGPLNVRLTVKEIRCILDGVAPLTLEATGVCVERTGETKTLEFSTEVRKEVKQSFEVENTQDVDWKLQPQVMTTEPAGVSFFTCPREVIVHARKRVEVEVTYLPFTMTEGGDDTNMLSPASKARCEKHRGSVFIGTPDGNAILYSLEGVALPPKVDKRLQERVPCKKQHNQRVPVKNWLHERQRFSVKVELVDPDPSSQEAQGINLQGVGTLDLPPGLERDYRFSIYSYHENTALVRVSLTSQETGEFIVVEVELDFYAPESLATIKLEAACRQQARHKIAVANPLSKPAKFIGTSSNPYIRFGQELEVPAKSERTLDLLFRPVEEGEGDAEVTLKSDELGVYPYTVRWRATPAGLERSLTLKAPLGGSVFDFFKFQHLAKVAVDYKARIEPAPGHKAPITDFILEESSVSAPACEGDTLSKEVKIRVRYEPSALGTRDQPSVAAMLVLSGPGGGEYKAVLTGFAQPPQPQGPYEIGNGKAASIDFRNPFDKPTEFTLQVDNPCFMVPMRSQMIDPQKTVQIQVSFKAEAKQGGRLIISCKQVSAPWIFYLKGEL
jgi:hydrocephalus-inducing protein